MRATPRILRVTDLNRRVRGLLDADAVLADVWVEGEVSQPSFPASGHCFFTLKDSSSQVRAALFRDQLVSAGVRPAHGMQVIIHGRVRVYEPQGAYQLYVDSITVAGAGDLHARYEALRAKLAAEGLFDERRKRPIPRWPRRIGVVTSPVGVVWRDIANVMRRRYPLVELVLSASSVQGERAAPAIVRALQRLYDHPGLDVVILARGGGSLEDLWSFNDERVVRAVVARRCRSSSASGTSRTRRSPTSPPTCAPPRPAPPPSSPRPTARSCRRSSTGCVIAPGRAPRAGGVAAALPRGRGAGAHASRAGHRRRAATRGRPARPGLALRGRPAGAPAPVLDVAPDALRTLSPAATLERGYAVARTPDGRIVHDAATLDAGDPLQVVVARGSVDTRVERTGSEELIS